MKLSPAQVQSFWREWTKRCKAMNWTKAAGMSAAEIDVKRKELLARCGFNSLTEVDRVDGFTKVLNELRALQGVSIQAGLESEDLTINRARTIRHQILTEIVPCLELYVEDVRGYMVSIMQDKNRWWKIDRPACQMTLNDLDAKPIFKTDKKTSEMREWPSTLEQMQYTLAARLNAFRKDAGESIHQMKMRASVPCSCAICRGNKAPIPVPGDDELVDQVAAADPELGPVYGESACSI